MSIAIQLAACAVVSATFSGIVVSMVMASKIRKLKDDIKSEVRIGMTTSPGASASVREGTMRAMRSAHSRSTGGRASTDHGFTTGVSLGSISSDSSSSCSSSSSSSFSSCD